jgi:hypothetical protein
VPRCWRRALETKPYGAPGVTRTPDVLVRIQRAFRNSLNTDEIFFAKKFNLGTKNTPVGWRFGWVVFARTDLLFLARRSVRNAVPKKVGDRGRWKRTVTGHASGSVARRSAAKTSARLRTMTLVLTENCVRVIQRISNHRGSRSILASLTTTLDVAS